MWACWHAKISIRLKNTSRTLRTSIHLGYVKSLRKSPSYLHMNITVNYDKEKVFEHTNHQPLCCNYQWPLWHQSLRPSTSYRFSNCQIVFSNEVKWPAENYKFMQLYQLGETFRLVHLRVIKQIKEPLDESADPTEDEAIFYPHASQTPLQVFMGREKANVLRVLFLQRYELNGILQSWK